MTHTARSGALVLGASRGLGLLVATELGRVGYDLAVVARSPEELDDARPELEATGARVTTLPADLADRRQAEACVDAAVRELGGLDVVGPAPASSASGRWRRCEPTRPPRSRDGRCRPSRAGSAPSRR